MPHQETWVLVANSSQAKLFRLTQFPKIEPLQDFAHPESRLHDQDLTSDRPGRNFDSMSTRRHAYEAKHDPKSLEIDKFGKILSEYLNLAHENGDFTRLYLLANPSFLGVLRQELSARLQGAIVSEIAKDMTEHPKSDIEKQLEMALI